MIYFIVLIDYLFFVFWGLIMNIIFTVPEKDLDGMEVLYKEINGESGIITDIFQDGHFAEIKVNESITVEVPNVQLQTMDNFYIVYVLLNIHD